MKIAGPWKQTVSIDGVDLGFVRKCVKFQRPLIKIFRYYTVDKYYVSIATTLITADLRNNSFELEEAKLRADETLEHHGYLLIHRESDLERWKVLL